MVRVKQVDGAGVWQPLGLLAERPDGEPVSADEIATQIEQLIVAACLAAGTRLPSERDLVQLTGTSRPTVSQAIRILVVKGLVESRRGSGAYVRRKPESSLAASVDLMLNLNQQSVSDLANLRLWLETVGIEQAIEHGTADELAAADRALQEMTANAGDTAAWMSADTHFHATLVRAGHNPYLSSIYESIHETLINYEYRSWIAGAGVPKWLRPQSINGIVALHAPILDAVRNKDEEAGRIAVLHHHYVMAQHLQLAGRD